MDVGALMFIVGHLGVATLAGIVCWSHGRGIGAEIERRLGRAVWLAAVERFAVEIEGRRAVMVRGPVRPPREVRERMAWEAKRQERIRLLAKLGRERL